MRSHVHSAASTSQAAPVSQAVCKVAVPGKLLQALRSMLRSSSTALPSSTLLDTSPLSLLQLQHDIDDMPCLLM